MEVIRLEAVSKHYGVNKILDNISFNLTQGEIVGFLGPNGAGKTTTMRLLCGLIRPTSGKLRIFNENVPGPVLSTVGTIIEEPSFYPYLSGKDNLLYAAKLANINTKRISEVLEIVGLQNRARDRVHKYSQGMRQRLGLARALLTNPQILLLDEPNNGLDPEGVAELRDILRSFSSQGVTILISSHILAELEKVVGRVLIINKGKIIANESIDNLFKKENVNSTYKLQVSDREKAFSLLEQQSWVIKIENVESKGGFIKLSVVKNQENLIARTLIGANIDILELLSLDKEDDLENIYLDIVHKSREVKND